MYSNMNKDSNIIYVKYQEQISRALLGESHGGSSEEKEIDSIDALKAKDRKVDNRFPEEMQEWFRKKGFSEQESVDGGTFYWLISHMDMPNPNYISSGSVDSDNPNPERIGTFFFRVSRRWDQMMNPTSKPDARLNRESFTISIILRREVAKGNYERPYYDTIVTPNTRQLDAAWEVWERMNRDADREQLDDFEI